MFGRVLESSLPPMPTIRVCPPSAGLCSGIRDLRGTADVFPQHTEKADWGENLEHFSGKLGAAWQPGHSKDCWPTDSEAAGETLQVTFCIRTQRVIIMVTPNASHSKLVRHRGEQVAFC